MKKLLLILLYLCSMNAFTQNILGDWHGVANIQGTDLRIIFHIVEEGDKLLSTLDSPDQGATGIPTTATTFEAQQLMITAEALGLKYKGTLAKNGQEIEGTLYQGSLELPMVLSKEKIEKKVVKRLQDPVDFPYLQEEVKFVNSNGGHSLAGTLTIPEDKEFEQVVILISGSGPQDRNEEVKQFNHRPFLVLSDYLTRQGIAVLRYDDRGCYASEGDYKSATSKDFAEDVTAAIAYLKERPDMQAKKIGLVGHSEGGMIAPMVAADKNAVDFVVSLAGIGMKGADLLVLQSKKIGLAEGASPELIDINCGILEKMYGYLRDSKDSDKATLKTGLLDILEKNYQALPGTAAMSEEEKATFFEEQMSTILTDWFLYLIRFDPADYLSKVNCPFLAANGALDMQVPVEENFEGMEKALAHNSQATFKSFENLNHLFQTAKTGAPSEYGEIEETFNEEAMKYLVDWMKNLNP